METVLNISVLVSTDIRSRANANIIRSVIDGVSGKIILDFSGVTFISRSFADELYNILNEQDNVSLANESELVKSMLEAVSLSRKNKRVQNNNTSEIKEIDDMKSLESFLATI
jgi:hypothetical protein